jgi:hypothetical protein
MVEFSAAQRRQAVDWWVFTNASFYGDERDVLPKNNCSHLTNELVNRISFARTERARLEAKEDCVFWKEFAVEVEYWSGVEAKYREGLALLEAEEQRQEAERLRAYHRSLGQKGKKTAIEHHSPEQREIEEACRNMRADGITARIALNRLNGKGHKMPDGRIVRFTRRKTQKSFERYWARAKNVPQ